MPSTGRVVALELPDPTSGSISGVEAGGEVTPYYDPMIAKLIVHEATREAALERLAERSIGRCLQVREAMSLSLRRCAGRPNSAKARWILASSIAIWRQLGAVPHATDRAAAALGVAYLLADDAEGPAAERVG